MEDVNPLMSLLQLLAILQVLAFTVTTAFQTPFSSPSRQLATSLGLRTHTKIMTDPIPNEDDFSQCLALLTQKGIKVVAFDMDQTAVSVHSRGKLKREDLNEFLGHATEDFKLLVPKLYQSGFGLSIATHSDEAEFGGSIQPESHILGSELARALVEKSFPPEIASVFCIIAYNPRARADDKQEDNKIKRYHIRKLVEHFKVLPEEIVFLDDTKNVVDDLNEKCGVKAFIVDPTKGFQISDLLNNI